MSQLPAAPRWLWLGEVEAPTHQLGAVTVYTVYRQETCPRGKSEQGRVDAGASSRPGVWGESMWVRVERQLVIKHPSLGIGKQPCLAEIAGK